MANLLQNQLNQILNEKNEKIIPENIKKDVQIFDIVGTYEGSSGEIVEGIKQFATEEEMQADASAQEGDLAVVYRSAVQNWDGSSAITKLTFPETVVLPSTMTGSCQGYYGGDIWLDINGSVSATSANFRIYGDSMYQITYTSSDGLTYTRTDSYKETITLNNTPITIDMSTFSEVCGYFMTISGMWFGGLFKHNSNYVEPLICNFIDTLTYSDGAVTDVVVKPIDVTKIADVLENASITRIARPTILVNRQNDNDVYIISNDGMNVSYLYDITNDKYIGTYCLATPTVIYHLNLLDETVTTVSKTECDWFDTTTKFADATNYYMFVIYEYNSYKFTLGSANAGFELSTVTNGTVSSSNSVATDLYTKLVVRGVYFLAANQFTATADDVYGKEFYGANGAETGTLGTNPDNSFMDINAKFIYDLQTQYDEMEPIVLTNENKTINGGIYFIPEKSDGTPLYDTSVITSFSGMFRNFTYLRTIPRLNTSNAVGMSEMFQNCKQLKKIPLIDTSKVTNMNNMFYLCSELVEVPLLDMSSVIYTANMFSSCPLLKSVPPFNMPNVTQTSGMFGGCRSITSVPLLNTSKVNVMGYMFSGCSLLVDVPLFDTSSATNMDGMFNNCSSLSDESLNNILQMCANAVNITENKTLSNIGLTSEQVTRCQSLSNYQAFLDAGWTTGY